MSQEAITQILSLAAIASAAISAFVSLYVKSAIGPLVVRQQEQENRIEDRRKDCVDLWTEFRRLSEKVARLEGQNEQGE